MMREVQTVKIPGHPMLRQGSSVGLTPLSERRWEFLLVIIFAQTRAGVASCCGLLLCSIDTLIAGGVNAIN